LIGIIEKGQLLAQGTVQEITENLQENLTLVLTVDSNVDEAVALCSAIENVEEAVASGNEIRLVFAGTRSLIADLNALLVQHEVRVVSLKEEEADLEQVFLSVTGQGQD
jgi:ABC-2 type transport system ATP-binding protein